MQIIKGSKLFCNEKSTFLNFTNCTHRPSHNLHLIFICFGMRIADFHLLSLIELKMFDVFIAYEKRANRF